MSDMIDRLDAIARASGAESAERLAAAQSDVAAEISAGRKRRRTATGVLAGAAVVVLGAAAAIIVPRLADTPLPPANQGIVDVGEVVVRENGLTSYADGSMTVVTSKGAALEVAPRAAGQPAFALLDMSEMCDPALASSVTPGWTFTDRAYQGLVTFGRPQIVDATGFHIVTQGQRVTWSTTKEVDTAFSFDADAEVAQHLVLRLTSWTVDSAGTPVAFSSMLDAQPAIDYVGDTVQGTESAVVQSSTVAFGGWCPDADAAADGPVTRYLSVTVFLNDGEGHTTPLATHDSWIVLAKEAS